MTQPPAPGHEPAEEPARDSRLAAFAEGGPGDTCLPGPELAATIAELAGPEWQCQDATDEELIGLLGRWDAIGSWAEAGKLGVVRELLRRRARPGLLCTLSMHGDLPDRWEDGVEHEVLHSQWCPTITDTNGVAVAHGCAKPDRTTKNRPASRDGPGPWAFTRRDHDPGPPGGYGTWALTLPDGRELVVKLEPIPVTDCDHRHESHGYQPNDALRHLVQVRDGTCTFPPCNRHARESDFEHAIPYDKGGRTCACNGSARSRRCHRVKQSLGWTVTQPKPGWHQWTTPSGRTYTQGPMKYPA